MNFLYELGARNGNIFLLEMNILKMYRSNEGHDPGQCFQLPNSLKQIHVCFLHLYYSLLQLNHITIGFICTLK